MPPPLATPTRLQTLRNQTLKLHLPGSGRNYISLPTGEGMWAGLASNFMVTFGSTTLALLFILLHHTIVTSATTQCEDWEPIILYTVGSG